MIQVTKSAIRAGVWEGVLQCDTDLPDIEVLYEEKRLEGLVVTAQGQAQGDYVLRVPIPVQLLSDGVQTFLIRAVGAAGPIAHFTIIMGVAIEDDLRAEIDLLRAELDMLKRAFRRHCLDTAV